MNVFIDTSILYDDPFWQNSYNKALLDRARNKRLNIFLSKVVIKELHRNFQKQVDELVKKISDSSREINRKFVVNKIPIFIPNRETLNENFLKFYDDLLTNSVIKIIDFENSFLPEIIERAVWRKKPFTENKTELKDTVIWLSYSKYVKDQNIEFPYFLTTNINDFCNISDKTAKVFEVHDDLKIDCDHFKVFKYSKDFISEVIEKIEAENKSRYKEVAKEKVNVDFVTEVVYSKSSEVEDDVRQNIEKYDISQLFKIDYFFNGYIEAKVTNWGSKCNDIEIDFLDDCCIISGYQELDVEIEGFEYIFDSNYAEDNHKFFGSMHILVKAYFTFTLDTDFEVQDFAIDRIEF